MKNSWLSLLAASRDVALGDWEKLERELEREGGERIGCGLREEEEKDPRGGKGVVIVVELN